ncbi:MAG: transcriptional repressor LexA [Calditrichaeota bacterium]|nr:MAG: transcriptional repressor LexA [Calditrichota bacterium]
MVLSKLTDKQERVLQYIKDQIHAHGSAPTIREIGKYMKISSTNGVRLHINALIKKGYLKKNKLIARGLELTSQISQEIKTLPLVGSVPAGLPIDAIENIESEFALDASFLPKGDLFSLKVSGDSMKNAGIYNGDIVLVQKQQIARSGEIIVAQIGDEATVKRYFPEKSKIRLQPENDDFEPIIVDKNSPHFSIAGKVVGLIRKL